LRLKLTRAVGRVNRANSSPLRMAKPRRPTSASMPTSTLDARVFGTSLPYPMVASVCTLKNTQSSNRASGPSAAPAIAPGPASQYSDANTRLTAR